MFLILSKILKKKFNLNLEIKLKKINKIKIIKKYCNYIYINNKYNNYNKIIFFEKQKTTLKYFEIPIINKNCKIDKIISSIKTTCLDKIYILVKKSIEYFIIKQQCLNFKYEEIIVPLMVNYSNILYSGQIPNFYNNLYKIKKNIFLIPTSEVILNSLSFFIKNNFFPIKIICSSYCFRKEIGNFGIENTGIKRQQQFKKIEIFQFVKKKKSFETFYSICSNIIFILKLFKIKFRIIKLNLFELNNNSFLTFDFEVWDHNNNIWVELSSLSLCLDISFNIYLKKKKIHIINASCLPLGRLIYIIFLVYRINNRYIKIPKKIKKILTELLKW